MKKLYNLSKKIVNCSIIWWIAETIFFLLLQGWHLTATTQAEKICDDIFLIGLFLAGSLRLIVYNMTVNYMIQIFDILGEELKEEQS